MKYSYEQIGPSPLPKKQRPECKFCGKKLDPQWKYQWFTQGRGSREFIGKYGKGDGNFCRELHALWWADNTIQAIKLRKIKVTRSESV